MVPDTIQTIIDAILAEVRGDAQHQMNPDRRGELYRAFFDVSDAAIRTTPCWQAILSARRVLPMFEQKYPDDPAPREILDTAVGYLQGTVDETHVEEMIDLGHHALGNAWGYDERDITWPQCLGANSAYRALVEAHGYRPLEKLPGYVRNGVVTDWTDNKLSELAGDTASTAAMALAYDDRGLNVDPEKLLKFWEWWLTDALDEAVLAAQDGRLST